MFPTSFTRKKEVAGKGSLRATQAGDPWDEARPWVPFPEDPPEPLTC